MPTIIHKLKKILKSSYVEDLEQKGPPAHLKYVFNDPVAIPAHKAAYEAVVQANHVVYQATDQSTYEAVYKAAYPTTKVNNMINYTREELETAIKALTRSIEFERISYLKYGYEFIHARIEKETKRKDFLSNLLLDETQSTFSLGD